MLLYLSDPAHINQIIILNLPQEAVTSTVVKVPGHTLKRASRS
jgi:hypothetical protein